MTTSYSKLLCLSALVLQILSACNPDNPANAVDSVKDKTTPLPNIVIFYVDDLGYGDVGSYGAIGVETPNIDRLAANGVRFTDAHSSAATCTPSRYSLLTGEHGFRRNAAILRGDAPLLIPTDKPTLPAMLKRAGYTTAVVGKWHLGLGDGDLDWNAAIRPGPLEIGFDYAFLLPATGDRVPTVYVEDHQVVNLDSADPIEVSYKEKVGSRPTGYENPELMRYKADSQHSKTIVNGVSRIGHMGGGESALWIDEEFPDVFSAKAAEFIRANKDGPFFLFHSFHDIHVPRLPNPRFKGKSTMGPRGDAIAQTDWIVGALVDELEELGISDRTLLIFTSDNGPVLNDGYEDQAVELLGEHKPAGPLRGSKYSAYEGGTRVPTITYWPGKIKPGSSDALVSQLDIYASIARLVDEELSDHEATDSRDQLAVWLGQSNAGRDYLVEESVGGLVLRSGSWKYIPGVENPRRGTNTKGVEVGFAKVPQLYELGTDIGEQVNLAAKNPGLVSTLQLQFERIVGDTYRPGLEEQGQE
ncbi:MAG: arylsulfatase [Bacteroidetes bacterium]|nr:MAG: arylsulfatase [Gammaproteobacteria bacterium]RLD94266.1 MAG: arylsulfatase [Bacteroidota bacterium]